MNDFGIGKVSMFIEGLDEVLYGGIPEGRTTAICGGAGCGKSILAMEFIYRSALDGNPGVFINFEEYDDSIRDNFRTLGWDLEKIERDNLLFLHTPENKTVAYTGGEFDLKGFTSIIDQVAIRLNAKRIALDAIDVLLRSYPDQASKEKALYSIHKWLQEKGYTAVVTLKDWDRIPESSFNPEILNYLIDCLIFLDRRVENQITTRRLRVEKYRGSGFSANEHPFIIDESGILLAPVTSPNMRKNGFGERVSSGSREMDAILGGGYRRHACVLVSGPTGAGKTTIAALFAKTMCENGENVLYISFEESRFEILDNMKSVSIDLEPAYREERLFFFTNMPESQGAEEHLIKAIKIIQAQKSQHVIVDAISACSRMGSAKAAFDYVIRLVSYCKTEGITVLLTNQTVGVDSMEQLSGAEISSNIDVIIRLSLLERSGEINRTLTVLKARGSNHSKQLREFSISDSGIEITDVYIGSGTVLTGVERQVQEEHDQMEAYRIQRKQKHLEAQIDILKLELTEVEHELKSKRLGIEKRSEMRG